MLNNYIIPILVIVILGYGFFKKTSIYDNFIEGSIDGLKILIEIIPAILAMIFAVNIFIQSGVLDTIGGKLKDVIPMFILRPISGNASLAALANLYKMYGPDSYLGYLGSVIQGATDTTIYVLALYFGSVHIRKTKYALGVGLFADVCGILAAFIVVRYFF
ncbi:MAG TPA: spore maturation protein [Candidatus Coprovivens excrementavium]|nr:spore maturation protein [Candidatus Coprovivens excrementavium]